MPNDENENEFYKFSPVKAETGKARLLTNEEYGAFVRLANYVWLKNGRLKDNEILPRLLSMDQQAFSALKRCLISLELIVEENGFLRVKYIDEQLGEIRSYREKQAIRGRMGGKKTQAKSSQKRKEKGEKREMCVSILAGAESLAPEDQNLFAQWLEVWRNNHGEGKPMSTRQQEMILANLLRIPAEFRSLALQNAIAGGWKHLYDPRESQTQNNGKGGDKNGSNFSAYKLT